MKHIAWAAGAALLLGMGAVAHGRMGAGVQSGGDRDPATIRRLLLKFDQAQASAPFRYPTACVAGTAEEYTGMALRAALQQAAAGMQLHLWTVPEQFQPLAHPDPQRKTGRCDYRVSFTGQLADRHFIADFLSRKRPRTGEIAYVKVWRQGAHDAVLVAFPNGPRGVNPDITFKAVPIDTQPGTKP